MIFLGGGGGGLPKGSSFNLDTTDARMTKVVGTGLKMEMDLIEIATAGGTLKYLPTHFEFATGLVRWITMINGVGTCNMYHSVVV